MPFTGTGTGIQNANDVFFSSLAANQVLRYNNATSKWNNINLSVTTTDLANDAVTEPKLSASNVPTSNQLLSWSGTTLTWLTVDKTFVGLANVDNTSDVNKPISTATQTALTAKANDSAVVHNTGAETVAGVKTFSSSPIVPTPTTGTQAANKSYVDTQVSGVTSVDATTTSKGIVQLAGDLAGTAASPTVATGAITSTKIADGTIQDVDISATAAIAQSKISGLTTSLGTKASTSTTITGTNSVSGGGDLSANRTLSLVGDSALPGNSKYYGTDGTGTKGFYAIPAGDPTMGGDLSGTASNAQIVANAVGTTELASTAVTAAKVASDAITEPKLSILNSPSTGQVLSWNGTNMTWAGALAFAFTKVSVSANYTVSSSFEYVFADATSAGITVTLPAPQNNAYVRVKRMSTNANSVQVVAPAGSFLDAVSVGSDVLNNPYDSAEYWSDGSNWYR